MNYDETLKNFKRESNDNFLMLHLNINSLFNKTDDLDTILSIGFDLITLNETKLDHTVPEAFYINSSYKMLRLDRNRNGGGVAILIKKEYKYKSFILTNKLECLHLQLNINNTDCNFLAIYKPPVMNELFFIDELDNLISLLDSSLPLSIIGDLNIDLKSSKGKKLLRFMTGYNLSNFVDEYTRIASKYNNKTNKLETSKSLIDVIFHNYTYINKTLVLPCPFSDHCFVVAELKLPHVEKSISTREVRCLNERNIEMISKKISASNFNILYQDNSINQSWNTLKKMLNEITEDIAPLRTINFNTKTRFPWYDKELHSFKTKRDSSYKDFKLKNSPAAHQKYKEHRARFQSLKRKKMIDYFKRK